MKGISKESTNTVEIKGYIFEYSLLLQGESEVNIVLVNGLGMPMHSWNQVYPGLVNLGNVFAYNRLDVGKSSKADSPQSGLVVVNALKELLEKLDIKPPYFFVSHSIGVFIPIYMQDYIPTKCQGWYC